MGQLQPGEAQWDNYNPVKNGDYAGSCMPFGWIRSRPVGNERVFVLTPNVELMEYSCMEGNLQSLMTGAITPPWLGPKDDETNLVYGKEHGCATKSAPRR